MYQVIPHMPLSVTSCNCALAVAGEQPVVADEVFVLQLGDGTTTTRSLSPVSAVGLSGGVVSVALGIVSSERSKYSCTCALF